MTRFEELLLSWQDHSISVVEVAELKRHLATAEGRAAAAKEFLLTGVLLESVRIQQAAEDDVDEEPVPPARAKTSQRPLSRRIALACGGLAVCALLVMAFWPMETPKQTPSPEELPAFAKVERVQGETFVVNQQRMLPATRGQVMAPGDGIATEGAESEAVVHMADAVRLKLGGDTTVYTTIDEARPAETNLVLEKGDLLIEVTRSLRRKKTTVQTALGSVVAETEETALHLSDAAGVVVVRGEVSFQHKTTGKSIRLREGEYLAIDSDGELYASQVFAISSQLWTTFPRVGLNTVSIGYSLAFSPTDQQLAAVQRFGEGGGRVGLIKGQEPSAFKGERCVQFSPDGKWLATADQANVLVYDAADHDQVRVLSGKDRKTRVQCLAFSPNGKWLVVGRGAVKDVADLEIWDLAAGMIRHTFREHTGTINVVAFSPDGKWFVSGGMDKTTILWNVEKGIEAGRVVVNPSHVVWSLAFAPQGERLAIATGPADFRIREASEVAQWDFAADKIQSRLRGHSRAVTSVIYTRDGKTLITGSADTTVRFWDDSTARQYGMLKGHKAAPGFEAVTVALSADGASLATASLDRTVLIWPTSWIRGVRPVKADAFDPLNRIHLATRGGER